MSVRKRAIAIRDAGALQWCLRLLARRRLASLEAGAVTVVIASWNGPEMLEVALAGVRRFADRRTTITVIDNHSRNDPRGIVERFGARLVRLPVNTGHAMALDIGFLLARTEYVMSLDIDAFPYSRAWMPTFLDPLDKSARVVGCDWYRHYAHPCCLAMRTRHFVEAGHSFKAEWDSEIDVGEMISIREGPGNVSIVPKTGNIAGTGYVGASYGDVVYHNAYGTRHLRLADPDNGVLDVTETWATKREHALGVWADGLARFGPATWNRPD